VRWRMATAMAISPGGRPLCHLGHSKGRCGQELARFFLPNLDSLPPRRRRNIYHGASVSCDCPVGATAAMGLQNAFLAHP